MARRKKGTSKIYRNTPRVLTTNARFRTKTPSPDLRAFRFSPTRLITAKQFLPDRRIYTPEPYRFLTGSGKSSAISLSPPKKQRKKRGIRLEIPTIVQNKRVNICVRRQTRKEVIFAKTGGGSGMRKPRRTQTSKYSCKG